MENGCEKVLAILNESVYDIIILTYHTNMTTISVPVPAHMEEFIKNQIKSGHSSSKAEVFRRAITLLAEQEAIREVLDAAKEPTLRGDLRVLAKQLRTK